MKNKHVAVLLGGFSSERPVSLSSGKACADELEKEGYQVTRVDVARDVGAVLGALKPDVVFNALHGPFGEDGTIQGILEYLGETVRARVLVNSGIRLQWEIKRIGNFRPGHAVQEFLGQLL